MPVIASPRSAFEACIEHGKNGFLAEDPDDWYGLLCALARSEESLRGVARAAHESVLAAHTIQSRGSRLAEHLLELAKARVDTSRRRGVPLTFRAQRAEASS